MLKLANRDDAPAICVKDHNVWAHDPRTAAAIAELYEDEVTDIYEGVQADFWDIARDVAITDFGYRNAYSDGRMGGWLVVAGTTFLEYLEYDDPWTDQGGHLGEDDDPYECEAIRERDRFLEYAGRVEGILHAAEATFVQRLNAAVADLEARREANIIRSNN